MKRNHQAQEQTSTQDCLEFTFLRGEAQQGLASIPDATVHAVITDPPYGLSDGLDIDLLLEHWLAGQEFVNDRNGYAGAEWDNSIPGPELWREVFRVLKPGSFVLAFSSARTIHLLGLALQLSGFQIRDQIHWVYRPARPTSGDLGKVDSQYSNLRATLRPSHEPIIVARKPLIQGYTLLENLDTWGTGALNHQSLAADGGIATNVLRIHSEECSTTTRTCTCRNGDDADIATQVYAFLEEVDGSIYCPKPNKAERPVSSHGITHETVKPLHLMRQLVRAASAPGQTVLDPFLGSGTTAEAALLEGRHIIGCEMTSKYWEHTEKRIERVRKHGITVRSSAPPIHHQATSMPKRQIHGESETVSTSSEIETPNPMKGQEDMNDNQCSRCGKIEARPMECRMEPYSAANREICTGCAIAEEIEKDLGIPGRAYLFREKRRAVS